ncbi:MAG: extracellular solute-binding protein [Clostridiales bacterium]|jgi:multiple sugar transport system substrate-binding protein|nr:extracellular solute-binding protein [Clostridiales bacterium]
MKPVIKLAAIIGTVLSLAACAGQSSPAAGSTTAAAAESETPGTGQTEEVTLTYYGFSEWVGTEPFQAVYEEAKAKFEAENPGYKIELQSDPWGDWEQKYKTMFASGNPADIFIVNNPDFPTFANSGSLLDIGSYTGEGYFGQFFPGVQSMYNWQGINMAIAFTTDCRILWYNKDIFTEAGLDPNTPPKTWGELVSFANTITETTGKYGFGMDLGLKEFPMQGAFNASSGSIINVAPDGSITPNVNTPEFRAYLQMLLDLKPTFEPDYATLTHHDVATQFVEGQMGMIIGNTLTETDIYSKSFYGQALVPKMDASAPDGSYGGGFGIAVSAQTKAPEQAVKFAQILCDAAFNARLISDIPASEAGLAQCDKSSDPNFSVYLEQIKFARQAQPKTLYYADIDAAAYDTVVEAVVGGKDIDAAIAGLEAKISEIVAQ